MPKGKPRPKKNLSSQRVINALKTTKERGERHYDADIKGFGIVVYPSGRKVFFADYGTRTRRRRMTLGEYGIITPAKARKKAKSVLGEAAEGGDPLGERQQRLRMPTVKEWAAEWLAKFELEAKPHTHGEYKRYLSMIPATWVLRPLDEIRPPDIRKQMMKVATDAQERVVQRTLRKLTGGKVLPKSRLTALEAEARDSCSGRGRITANRWLEAWRSCLSSAVREGILESNPGLAVGLNDGNPPRDRVLNEDEIRRLYRALEPEDDHSRAAIRLALETGARRAEILHARWEDLHLKDGTWRIPSPKAGRPQVIPLAKGTVELLSSLKRVGPYVIVGKKPDRPRHDLKSLWTRLCTRAELEDVHFHDLRRTFGKRIERQAGLHVASKLLRHSDVRITSQVYSPFDMDELRSVVEIQRTALDNVVSIGSARLSKARRRGHG
jgi:integrase